MFPHEFLSLVANVRIIERTGYRRPKQPVVLHGPGGVIAVGQRLEVGAKMGEQSAVEPENARSGRGVFHRRTIGLADVAKVVHERW